MTVGIRETQNAMIRRMPEKKKKGWYKILQSIFRCRMRRFVAVLLLSCPEPDQPSKGAGPCLSSMRISHSPQRFNSPCSKSSSKRVMIRLRLRSQASVYWMGKHRPIQPTLSSTIVPNRRITLLHHTRSILSNIPRVLSRVTRLHRQPKVRFL
jgi:hypothetical protein